MTNNNRISLKNKQQNILENNNVTNVETEAKKHIIDSTEEEITENFNELPNLDTKNNFDIQRKQIFEIIQEIDKLNILPKNGKYFKNFL